MIFVTVGTQLPFPRLLDAMDRIAARLGERIVAQTGPDEAPRPHLECSRDFDPATFSAIFAEARLVVAHAGIGTILSARAMRKPLVVMPRRFALGEHRNDHQLATARQLAHLPGVHVAEDEAALEALVGNADLEAADERPTPSREALIARLRREIAGERGACANAAASPKSPAPATEDRAP